MDSTASTGAAGPGILMRPFTGAPFRFDPGALSLELLTTGGPGPYRRFEMLHGPADLAAWAERSRLTPTPVLDIAESEVAAARELRDALFRAATARAGGAEPSAADVAVLNGAAAHPPLVPVLAADGAERHWAVPADGTALLATVARDAVELLTGPYAHRVRVCSGENCALVYVDTSRPGRRRWCSMERCGNRHKVRALRERRA
ncbi:CGNR zinc finger domain-containing protein [Streptomyces sp. NPDC048172]|uniref:CGNR zinc finger domain-containing protein n=1 Tax=Streptomyces sp. NPDC048172 TaxID=3365505 RepID=UPI003718C335